MNTSKVLVIVAVACLVLAAFGVVLPHVTLGWLGLAFLAGSKLV